MCTTLALPWEGTVEQGLCHLGLPLLALRATCPQRSPRARKALLLGPGSSQRIPNTKPLLPGDETGRAGSTCIQVSFSMSLEGKRPSSRSPVGTGPQRTPSIAEGTLSSEAKRAPPAAVRVHRLQPEQRRKTTTDAGAALGWGWGGSRGEGWAGLVPHWGRVTKGSSGAFPSVECGSGGLAGQASYLPAQ